MAPLVANWHILRLPMTRPVMIQPPYHAEVRGLPKSSRPHVSVIIPCYNYGKWLADCVNSVLEQSGVDIEVLIINDASTDNSSEVARVLAGRDARVHVIDHEKNYGHIPSVNEALQKVNGDYIVKLDADDTLTPGSLARATALLETHPTVGFVYGRPLHFGKHMNTMPRLHKWLRQYTFSPTDRPSLNEMDTRIRGWTIWPGETWLALLCARGANCISQPEVVIRSSALRSAGGYDVNLPHTSDMAMWLRLACMSDVAHVDGAIQGCYRVHPMSMQRTVNAGKLRDLQGRLAAFDSILVRHSRNIRNADELMRIVRLRLAAEALDSACRAFDRGRTHTEPVDGYIAFALQACGDATSLPQWWSVQRRQRVGARWSPYYPPFVLSAVVRRTKEEIGVARWWRNGI